MHAKIFYELIVTGHVIACAMQLLGMSSINEIPSSSVTVARGFIDEG